MNMASIGIPLFIFTVSCITANKGFVTVQCKTENTGQYGQKSLLECVVTTTRKATNPQIRVVTWKKVGVEEPLVLFYRGDTKQVSGYSFAEPFWNDKIMNVSLLITNTAVHDEGDYTCAVFTTTGSASSRTSLKVRATSVTDPSDHVGVLYEVPGPTNNGGSSLMLLSTNSVIAISVISALVTTMTILLILLRVKPWTRNGEKNRCVQQVSKDDLSKDMIRNDLDSVGAPGRSMQSLYDF